MHRAPAVHCWATIKHGVGGVDGISTVWSFLVISLGVICTRKILPPEPE